MAGPMRLDRYASAGAFLEAVGPWLTEREAEHNLILGIGATARDRPEMYQGRPYTAAVREGNRFVAAALRTPPWNLILSEVDDHGALDLLTTLRTWWPATLVVWGALELLRSYGERGARRP